VTPEARVTHRIPGRARLRVPERRGDAAWFEGLERQLGPVSGVLRLTTSPGTGSVLLLHRGPLEPLLRHAEERELFRCVAERPPSSEAPAGWAAALDRLRRSDPHVDRLLGGRPDTAAFGALLLGALGVLQLARGHVLPAGSSLLVDAIQLWATADPRGPGREGSA